VTVADDSHRIEPLRFRGASGARRGRSQNGSRSDRWKCVKGVGAGTHLIVTLVEGRIGRFGGFSTLVISDDCIACRSEVRLGTLQSEYRELEAGGATAEATPVHASQSSGPFRSAGAITTIPAKL
jgi:hypothetical protein